jgi:hypothetical protein
MIIAVKVQNHYAIFCRYKIFIYIKQISIDIDAEIK